MKCNNCLSTALSFSSRPTPEGTDNYVTCNDCGNSQFHGHYAIRTLKV